LKRESCEYLLASILDIEACTFSMTIITALRLYGY